MISSVSSSMDPSTLLAMLEIESSHEDKNAARAAQKSAAESEFQAEKKQIEHQRSEADATLMGGIFNGAAQAAPAIGSLADRPAPGCGAETKGALIGSIVGGGMTVGSAISGRVASGFKNAADDAGLRGKAYGAQAEQASSEMRAIDEHRSRTLDLLTKIEDARDRGQQAVILRG